MFDMLLSGAGSIAAAAFVTILTKNVPLPLQFESTEPPADIYDFVVVGAGCGGSAVASRLSETGASVLLLEAGEDAEHVSLVPSLGSFLLTNDHTWKIRSKSQTNAMLGFQNNSVWMYQGKSMGGSSIYNGMMFARGGRQDFDYWAMNGNTGWDYESVLPYFRKLETFKDFGVEPNSERYHGQNGPIGVLIGKVSNKLTDSFLKAGEELGYDVLDINGKKSVGFSTTQLTIKNGVRQIASEEYLQLAKGRHNLTVRPKATVTRILFNQNKRAVGIQYTFGGKIRTVRVTKEVILSAGAVNTPKILMLSGVGPEKHLRDLGIPVVAAVEGVGKNLQDHPVTPLTFALNKGSAITIKQALDPIQMVQYINNRTGQLEGPIGEEGVAWLNLGGDDPEWVDVWLQVTSLPLLGALVQAESIGALPETMQNIYIPLGTREGMSIVPLLARPLSRGSVSLRSADYRDLPIVDNNIFGNTEDLELSVKGIRAAYRVANTRVMKDTINPVELSKPFPGCSIHLPDTDNYWRCYCRHNTFAGYHLTSTAKMAPMNDPLGVVSPRLSVRGVSGVRVVDVSIMPDIVTANTMAAAYMIGEKGADLIKQDWGYQIDPIL